MATVIFCNMHIHNRSATITSNLDLNMHDLLERVRKMINVTVSMFIPNILVETRECLHAKQFCSCDPVMYREHVYMRCSFVRVTHFCIVDMSTCDAVLFV